MQKAVLLAATLLTGAIPVFAEQAPVNPQSTAKLGALRRADSANPYGKLFDTRDALKRWSQPQAPPIVEPPTSKDVCGATIIEASPFFDQRKGMESPKDANVRYPIRVIGPSGCDK